MSLKFKSYYNDTVYTGVDGDDNVIYIVARAVEFPHFWQVIDASTKEVIDRDQYRNDIFSRYQCK